MDAHPARRQLHKILGRLTPSHTQQPPCQPDLLRLGTSRDDVAHLTTYILAPRLSWLVPGTAWNNGCSIDACTLNDMFPNTQTPKNVDRGIA